MQVVQAFYVSGGPFAERGSAQTLVDALVAAARHRPRGGFTLYGRTGEAYFLSFATLLLVAQRIARGLQSNMPRGASVLLSELPRKAALCAFWGCQIAGVKPCLIAGEGMSREAFRKDRRCAEVWKALGGPIVLVSSEAGGEPPWLAQLPEAARSLRLDAWLQEIPRWDGSQMHTADHHKSVDYEHVTEAADQIAFTVVAGASLDRVYNYSHGAVLAHARSEAAAWAAGAESSRCARAVAEEQWSSLNWWPFSEPAGLLSHCASVHRKSDEVHAETRCEPHATLRLLSRHRVSCFASQGEFYRRALFVLGSHPQQGLDLGSIRLWFAQNGSLQDAAAAEFLRRVGGPGVLRASLVAPWGALLATSATSDTSGLAAVPGIELRVSPNAPSGHTAGALPDRSSGPLQVRGRAASPGGRHGCPSPAGWIDLDGLVGTISRWGLLSTLPGLGSFESSQERLRVAGGVEYLSEEIETVVEKAPCVQPGSAVVTHVEWARTGDQVDDAPGLPVAVAFVPVDSSSRTRASHAAQVRKHLAIALGIRPQFVLVLSPCDLPRDCRGLPSRTALRASLATFLFGRDEEGVGAFSGDEGAFEEDFLTCSLEGQTMPTGGDGGNQGDDGDDLEERLEGVNPLPHAVADVEGGPKDPEEPSSAIVVCNGFGGIGAAVCKQLSEEGHGQAHLVGSADDMSEDLLNGLQHVVDCRHFSPLPSGVDGSEEAEAFLDILRALHRAEERQKASQGRKLLLVSTGRHVRLAGIETDPRKSLLSGVVLCAVAEWPWLQAAQLDLSPELEPAAAAGHIAAELVAPATTTREVLVDSKGVRLVRRLRPLPVVPATKQPPQPVLRAALLAGGTGGIGVLWAKELAAQAVLLLGRSSPITPRCQKALALLATGSADIHYLQADTANRRALQEALEQCPVARQLDFAASLCESFVPPRTLLHTQRGAFREAALKLQGAGNLLDVLAALKPLAKRQTAPLPVLLSSSVVGLLGAPHLAVYSAGLRATEALCARARVHSGDLDPRCIALSAWSNVGITAEFPSLARAAPSAGLRVLSREQGLSALQAVFACFAAPRYGMLAVGIDPQHPRFVPHLVGVGNEALGPPDLITTTATLPGCAELVLSAARKVLRRDVKLGDSLVEAGLDSMSSMSLHAALVHASGGLDLPPNLLYDRPTALEVATFVHQKASRIPGGADATARLPSCPEEVSGDDLGRLLEDADARRSYHLGLAREAHRHGHAQETCEHCSSAMEGAVGSTLALALSLQADALVQLGDNRAAGEAYADAAREREGCNGAEHPDTAVALMRWSQWTRVSAPDRTQDLLRRFESARGSFFRCITWAPTAFPFPPEALPALPPRGEPLLRLRRLLVDGQALSALSIQALGGLTVLDVLRLRRCGLTELPVGLLSQLVQLRELWLTRNALADMPCDLASLARLRVLALEGNRLPKLPDTVCKLRRLLQLGLDEQRCAVSGVDEHRLPAHVLSVLRGRGCHARFPELLTPNSTPNLNTVFWANNSLAAVPGTLAHFSTSLRLLDLAHNRIVQLGQELFVLVNLRDLNLAGNRLSSLPPAIGKMRSLQQLWLHGNALKELPDELGELENLAILELHHNLLSALPASIGKLRKMNWLFAHGNRLSDDARLIHMLAQLPRLKVCGLGANRLRLSGLDLRGVRASFGLAWNAGLGTKEGVLSESLTTCDLLWDPQVPGSEQDILVVTFSAQGAPVAQGQAEVRALRDALVHVDALYVCDPANAWYLQDPAFRWRGLEYFQAKIEPITCRYKRVFMWGGSMGGSAVLLFAHLADSVHAFSPQVDLALTWPSFATAEVRDEFRFSVQDSVRRCRGTVNVHVGEENHTDVRHADALPARVQIHVHETANHNTMKHLKVREKLLPLLKFEILQLMASTGSLRH